MEEPAKYPLTNNIDEYKDMVLSSDLVKPFKSFGYKGKTTKTTVGELLSWLYEEKHWQVIISQKLKGYTYHVESTKEGGVKYYDSTAFGKLDAIKQGIKQALAACNAFEGSDYYFPEN